VLLLIATAVLDVGPFVGIGNDLSAILTVLTGFIFTLAHGSIALGWKRLGAFVGITFAISFAAEAVGVATGLVFGSYFYTDSLGPKILGVPPLIQMAYVTMSYCSFTIARAILRRFRTPSNWKQILSLCLCGAMVMVSWDVVMDPYQSTLAGDWIWKGGGPYFGVPLHNYVGWFCTVFVFLLVYFAFEKAHPLEPPSGLQANKAFQSEPILYYALTAFGILIAPWAGGIPAKMAAPQENYTGSLMALGQSMSLLSVFVMGFPVLIALANLFSSEEPRVEAESFRLPEPESEEIPEPVPV
jgi:putative membrane protein